MNELTFFDANCFLGWSGDSQPGTPSDAVALRQQLLSVGVQEALVYHASAAAYDASYGNRLLLEQLAGHEHLFPCWVVMPHHTAEIAAPSSLIAQMRASGVRAARLYPKRVGPLRSYLYGDLLKALADGHIPLLLDFDLGHWSAHMDAIDWDGLAWLLGEFPHLPVVLLRIGQAVDRLLLPFLARHGNLYLETSYYLGSGALERVVGLMGADRLVFGTGMPRYAPGPAITLITYSGIDQRAKALIAGENLRRLLGIPG